MYLPSGKSFRTVAAIGAVTVLAGLAVNTSASASTTPAPAKTTVSTAGPTTKPADAVSKVVGKGVLGGSAWSETLTYYPHTPKSFAPGHNPVGLVCLSLAVDGKTTSPYGDCAGVTGPADKSTSLGMYGERTLPGGATLFIAQPKEQVVSATMTFKGGRTTTVDKVTIPGTAFSAYVVPVPADQHMASLDEYDAQHHVVGHQDF